MDESFDPLKCTEDLPASPSHMDYDDMPELQEVDLDRSSDVYHVGSEVSHHHQEKELSSSPRDSGWLTELANIATSPQSPLVKDSAPHKRSSPVRIFGHSNSLHSYARPPLASSAPTPSRGHLRERRRVRASSESESGVFSMSSSFSDDEDMVWSHSWPETAWHCFLKGTRLRFHRGPNVEWQDAGDLGDSDDDSDDESVTSFSTLKRYGSEGLQLVNREETLSFSQAVLKLTFDPGSPDHGLLTAECRLDHPFFVKNKGWSSFYPSLTVVHHGIPCYEMQVGEVCLPPNHPDAINCDDSVVFDTFRSYDFTPLDSSAVYLLSSMARQRRTSQSSGGAASPDRDGSSPPHASGSRSVRGHAAASATSGTTVAAVTPTKCKRPMNAFMLFAKKFRVEYTQLYPGKDNRAISVILGDRWKKMRSEERRMYTLEAKALADQQKKINPDCWKRKRTNSQINDEATTKAHAVVARRSPKIRSNKKSGTKQDSAEIGCRDQDRVHAGEESLVEKQRQVDREKAEMVERIEHLVRTLSYSNEMTPERIQFCTIPNFFQYNTGFTYEQFNILCTVFGIPNSANAPPQTEPPIYKKAGERITLMPLRQQLLLVLMKLRQNFDHKELAFKFNISHQCVSVLFNSWIDYMFITLGRFPMWPHRDIITQKMPSTYWSEFPTTFAILDCTEIKIQQPSSLVRQSETFSNYKSTNTLKSLIVVDPRGSIMFCSSLFTGCVSDKEMVKKCGIVPLLRNLIVTGYLKQGDGLMADKGFLIDQEVEDVGLKLNILPPFVRSNRQMPPCDVSKAKTVAHHRVHVERAISKIKCFKIVSDIIPNHRLHNINEIWYVVSILSNFQPMIMKG